MPFSEPRTIRWNFSLFSGVIIVALTGFIIWFSTKTYTAHSTHIVSVLESQAGRLDRAFGDDVDYTAYLMEHILYRITNHEQDLDYIYDILASYSVDPKHGDVLSWTTFTWANAQHQILVTGLYGRLKKSVDISKRDYISRTVAKPGTFQIGHKIVDGATSLQRIIPGGMGMVDAEGRYIGTVVTGFNLERFTRKLEQALSTAGVSFWVLDQQKNIIAESTNSVKILGEERQHLLKVVQKISFEQQKTGKISSQSFFGNGVFSFYLASSKYPYYFVVSYDSALSASAFWHTLYSYMSEFFAILILVGGSLLFLKWRIIRPVADLSKAADEIARGNTQVSLPSSVIHEVDNLSRHLSKVAEYVENLKRMQEELQVKTWQAESAGRAKADFLALMSHELRTPLNAIIGYSDIQKRRAYGPENPKYHEYSRDIYDSGVHLLNIINDIIDVTRSENADFRMNKEEVDVWVAIEENIIEFSDRAAEKNIRITHESDEHLPRLMADGRRFRQMISNLLSNAIKFTPREGNIFIKAYVEGDAFLLRVQDTGIGMKQEDITKALQVFDQIDTGFSRKFQGLGLGLPLTKRLVELHEGALEINTELGKGLTAVLRFPLARTVFYPPKELSGTPTSANPPVDSAVEA